MNTLAPLQVDQFHNRHRLPKREAPYSPHKTHSKKRRVDKMITSSIVANRVAPTSKRGVQFDKVIVREYQRALGDNPSCSSGAPISLGHKYNPIHKEFTMDEYEQNKENSHEKAVCKRLSEAERSIILKGMDVSLDQIAQTVKECQEIQRKRFETMILLQQEMAQRKRMMTNTNILATL